MGYVPKRKTYALDFTGTDLDGLEITLHGLSTGQLIDAMSKRDAAGESGSDEFSELLELMAEKVVSWNVEDDHGQPVVPTLDAFREQDPDFNIAIIDAWTTAITGVAAPLDETSNDGELSLVASIPMDTPSESQAS